MLIFYSDDSAVRDFVQKLERDDTYCSQNQKEIIKLLETIDEDEPCFLFLDFDFDKKKTEAFNKSLMQNDWLVRIIITGDIKLKELKKHQKGKTAANGYIRKPLTIKIIQGVLNDFELADFVYENELMEEGTQIPDISSLNSEGSKKLSENTDIIEVPTEFKINPEVRSILSEHQGSTQERPFACLENDDIQEKFDHVFGERAIEEIPEYLDESEILADKGIGLDDDLKAFELFAEGQEVEMSKKSTNSIEFDNDISLDDGVLEFNDSKEAKTSAKEISSSDDLILDTTGDDEDALLLADDENGALDFSLDDKADLEKEETIEDLKLNEDDMDSEVLDISSDEGIDLTHDSLNLESLKLSEGDGASEVLNLSSDEGIDLTHDNLNLESLKLSESEDEADSEALDEGLDKDLDFSEGDIEGTFLDENLDEELDLNTLEEDESSFSSLSFVEESDDLLNTVSKDVSEVAFEIPDENLKEEASLNPEDLLTDPTMLMPKNESSKVSVIEKEDQDNEELNLDDTLDEDIDIDIDIDNDIDIDIDISAEDELEEISESPNDMILQFDSFDETKEGIKKENTGQSITGDKTSETSVVAESGDIGKVSTEEQREVFDQDITVGMVSEASKRAIDDSLSFHENEMLRMQATIRQLREERSIILSDLKESQGECKILEQENLGLRAELDETKIEVSILKKRSQDELEEYKYLARMGEEKKLIAEEKGKHLQKEFDRLQQKVRMDFGQVKQREKELESRLEMTQIDSDSQVSARDQKILELKRKIDQLEFNMENASIKEQQSRDDKSRLEERLNKIMKTLRGSIEVLEEDLEFEIDHDDKIGKF